MKQFHIINGGVESTRDSYLVSDIIYNQLIKGKKNILFESTVMTFDCLKIKLCSLYLKEKYDLDMTVEEINTAKNSRLNGKFISKVYVEMYGVNSEYGTLYDIGEDVVVFNQHDDYYIGLEPFKYIDIVIADQVDKLPLWRLDKIMKKLKHWSLKECNVIATTTCNYDLLVKELNSTCKDSSSYVLDFKYSGSISITDINYGTSFIVSNALSNSGLVEDLWKV